jgi:hypothetical protein
VADPEGMENSEGIFQIWGAQRPKEIKIPLGR